MTGARYMAVCPARGVSWLLLASYSRDTTQGTERAGAPQSPPTGAQAQKAATAFTQGKE